jgi:hypothetical protein
MIETDTRLSPFSQPWSSVDDSPPNFKKDWTASRKVTGVALLAWYYSTGNTLSLSGSAGYLQARVNFFFRFLPSSIGFLCVKRPSDLWEATFDPLFSCVFQHWAEAVF